MEDVSPNDAASPDNASEALTDEVEEAVLNRREWLELFFDLVVVAAIAVMAHGFGDHLDWARFGLFVVLFSTVWFAWLTVVMYADLAREKTRVRTITLAMFGVGLMAASNPLHFEDRASVFAIAFVVIRIMVGRGSLATGRLLRSWSGLQSSGAIIVWLASIWVPAPAKFAVWGIAIALDLALTLVRRGYSEEDLDALRERHKERTRRRPRRGDGRRREPVPGREGRRRVDPDNLSVQELDSEHFVERLGLFYIIVLGEGVSQLVLTASGLEWTAELGVTALAGGVTIAMLWRESFSAGFAGGLLDSDRVIPARFMMPIFLVSSLGVVTMSGGLGLALGDGGHLHASTQVMMSGGLLLHLLGTLAVGLIVGGGLRWLVRLLIPIAALLGLTVWALVAHEGTLPGAVLAGMLALCMTLVGLPGQRRDVRVG